MPSKCAPVFDNNKICYTINQLKCIIKAYNKHHVDKIKIGKNKKDLYESLLKKFSEECSDGSCILDKSFINNNTKLKLKKNFKPIMPDNWKNNLDEWLSTLDINDVMEQYEDKYPNFKFMGAVPIDCPTGYLCSLSNLNLNNLKKNKIYIIGIVFNLDTHDQPGSHWVATLIDSRKNQLMYYDSNGIPPPNKVMPFLKKILRNLGKMNKSNAKIFKNNTRHQNGNSECGMFSMNFIIKYLNGLSYDKIIKSYPTDKEMNQLRKVLYR